MINPKLSYYSDTILNVDLLSHLPPINTDLHTFNESEFTKLNALALSDSPITPIICNNKISYYRINKANFIKNINIKEAKKVYKEIHLSSFFSSQEKATIVSINIATLFLMIIFSNSEILLKLIQPDALVDILLFFIYAVLSITFIIYYLCVCHLVFSFDVVNDIVSALSEKNKNSIVFIF